MKILEIKAKTFQHEEHAQRLVLELVAQLESKVHWRMSYLNPIKGGRGVNIPPPPPHFKHLQTSPNMGLTLIQKEIKLIFPEIMKIGRLICNK